MKQTNASKYDSKILSLGCNLNTTPRSDGGIRMSAYNQISAICNIFDQDEFDLAPMPHSVSGFCAQILDNFVYCLGGASDQEGKNSTNEVHCMDLKNERWWIKTVSMNEKRSYHAAAVLDDKLVVTGGRNDEEELKSTELWKPKQNK